MLAPPATALRHAALARIILGVACSHNQMNSGATASDRRESAVPTHARLEDSLCVAPIRVQNLRSKTGFRTLVVQRGKGAKGQRDGGEGVRARLGVLHHGAMLPRNLAGHVGNGVETRLFAVRAAW